MRNIMFSQSFSAYIFCLIMDVHTQAVYLPYQK